MKKAPLLAVILCLLLVNSLAYGQLSHFPYSQSFEENFETGTNIMFLPHWWANETGSSSRIFRTTTAAQQGSAALAAEPTSSFVPDIRLLLDTRSLKAAQLSFWARSAKNGTGNRPSQLLLSFSADGGASFSSPTIIGTANSFPNADTDFQQYSFPLPPALLQNPQAVIRWQVRRQEEGTGTAARILLDAVQLEAGQPQLQLLSAEPLSASQLLLSFNMPVQKASAENTSNYSLHPAVPISGARLQPDNQRQVILQLAPLAPGAYTLKAAAILPAEEGSPLPGTELSFIYQPSPQFRDVVINEIFADPNPKGSLRPQPVVLPATADAEFIELYNASATAYSLQDLRLNGAQPSSFILEAGTYVILVPAGKKELYQQFGPVAEVQGWKSLSNSGGNLKLSHAPSGRVLDSLSYDPSWYGEAGKQEGGWSLEQINPYLQCSQPANWQASSDTKGATPAAANSVLNTTPDHEPPQLLQAVVADKLQVLLYFDEYIAPGSISPDQAVLEPGIPIAALQYKGQQLVLQLAEPLQEGRSYTISLTTFADCSGNTGQASAPLIWPKAAKAGELLINEIMYNPEAGEAEWIELYNPTNEYLNLQGWFLGLREGKIKVSVKLSPEMLLLPPKSFLVVSSQPQAVLQAFPEAPPKTMLRLAGMPSLRNSGDTIILLSPDAQLAEIAAYSDKLHHPLLHNSKGVSLERIDPQHTAIAAANWSSAASPYWGTPGLQNSQFRRLDIAAGALRIEPDVLEPSPDGVADVAFIHYQLPASGLSGTLYIFDASGREINRLASNQLLGQEGVLQWNGTNMEGERVRNGYYIVVLSVFGTDGFKQKWRKTIVVSSWL